MPNHISKKRNQESVEFQILDRTIMGIVILASDIAWLVVGSSYTYTPWLILGIVIFLATLVWLAVDIALMRESKPKTTTESTPPNK
jgi:hypothetical protein